MTRLNLPSILLQGSSQFKRIPYAGHPTTGLSTTGEAEQEQLRKTLSQGNTPSIRQYNLAVCHQHQFIWFRVAKVGVRTVKHYFSQTLPNQISYVRNVHYPPQQYQGYFKFGFVRNPWDRLVSCWRDKIIRTNYFRLADSELEQMQDFRAFVKFVETFDLQNCDPHLRLQSALMDLNMVNFVGRMERFDEDFRIVLQQLNLPDREIERKNVSQHRKPYPYYYDTELRERVRKMYRKDIQLFGYQFESSTSIV